VARQGSVAPRDHGAGRTCRSLYKPIAELIDQLNRQGDFAILSTAKTKIALSRFKGIKGLTDGLNRDTSNRYRIGT
jgi:hypothetical protein